MGDESRQLQQGLDAALLARLDAGTITIPVLPAVACAVLALLDDPRADDVAIASAIRNDPALAGHVMRVANSPLLRAGAVIVSLQQAIARLGIRRVGEIAFAACLGPRLFTAPAYARLIDVLWSRSLATALWAREIARHLRSNVEVAFLCGLLARIGHPVVLQTLQELLADGVVAPDEQAVSSLLQRHGVVAGELLAGAWHLPEPVARAIAHVDDFTQAQSSTTLVALVAVADAFPAEALSDVTAVAARLAEHPAIATINLYRADIEELLSQSATVLQTLVEMRA
ncbi:MAG: HDOD domain-containing protein [Pseudomonadales bacterium]|jgi:HD-like signal output (HDOD) protein|nr:HDOD domain-containing protein [Pseudomonadales bacterium]MCP5319723.1 HDOD domain-containing protein [Pseudomonadales bacterium]MCP5338329.1 HDOD domain-containing protein [Pseudomonadales bacterium]